MGKEVGGFACWQSRRGRQKTSCKQARKERLLFAKKERLPGRTNSHLIKKERPVAKHYVSCALLVLCPPR